MKVLHVDTGRQWRGGQQQVFYLHRELCRKGVESLLICKQGGELEKRTRAVGLPVSGLPLLGEWDLFSARKVARLMGEAHVTHLHLHSSHALAIGLIAAGMSGFSNVVATRRVDFIPKRHLFNRWKYGPGVKRFVAISEAIRRILIAYGIHEERISLVPSGVDPDRPASGTGQAFRDELGLSPEQPLVGNIAALTDHKGQRYLIDAAPLVLEKHPTARFVIVGEGELEARLKAQSEALGLGGRVLFTGFRSDVVAVMDALDLFAMPSHMEGLGTIVLDALSARRAVVAASAGGIPEIIEDGVHGLLVPVRDHVALADGIVRLLDDPELGRRLAQAGSERVAARFSAAAMAEGNLAIYEQMSRGKA